MEFKLETHVAITSYLHKKYSNKILQQVGFCMAVWDLVECGDGKVRWGDGAVWYKGQFGPRIPACKLRRGELGRDEEGSNKGGRGRKGARS